MDQIYRVSFGDITLRVKTEALHAKAMEVLRSVTALEKQFSSIQETVDRTSSYWLGEGGERHRQIYYGKQSEIEEIMIRLKGYAGELQAIARNYEEAEQKASEVSQTLPGDVIL